MVTNATSAYGPGQQLDPNKSSPQSPPNANKTKKKKNMPHCLTPRQKRDDPKVVHHSAAHLRPMGQLTNLDAGPWAILTCASDLVRVERRPELVAPS